MKIVVIKATSYIGRQIIANLAENNFKAKDVIALDFNSFEESISYAETIINITQFKDYNFKKNEIYIWISENPEEIDMIAKSGINKNKLIYIPTFNTENNNILWTVPHINKEQIATTQKNYIITSPCCLAIQISSILNAISSINPIQKTFISTYQGTSSLNRKEMNNLYDETKAVYSFQEKESIKFGKKIAFNCIPQIGSINENGHTAEEIKAIYQINKILPNPIAINITCVVAPIFVCNAFSIHIKCTRKVNIEKICEALRSKEFVMLWQNNTDGGYATHRDCAKEPFIYFSRIRKDLFDEKSFNLWAVADNESMGVGSNIINIIKALQSNSL